jgi:hypothetical protein
VVNNGGLENVEKASLVHHKEIKKSSRGGQERTRVCRPRRCLYVRFYRSTDRLRAK